MKSRNKGFMKEIVSEEKKPKGESEGIVQWKTWALTYYRTRYTIKPN